MPIPYNLVQDEEGRRSLTIFLSSGLITINDDHPKFAEILDLLKEDYASDEEIRYLADYTKVANEKLEALTERISIANGIVYFDGDPVDNALTQQIVRFIENDVDDWVPLANFFEKVATNPTEHSRKQLFNWLDRYQFTITDAGDIVAYKGVHTTNEKGVFRSIHSGYAIINGEIQEDGVVKQGVGDVIEMPRSKVQHDPNVGCSYGLHVGTYDYASGYGDYVIKVLVNPRDVVSVPNEVNCAKVRVSRYTVIEAPAQKEEALVTESNIEFVSYDEPDHEEYYIRDF